MLLLFGKHETLFNFQSSGKCCFEKNEKKRGERDARRSECDFVGLFLATIGLLGGQNMTL